MRFTLSKILEWKKLKHKLFLLTSILSFLLFSCAENAAQPKLSVDAESVRGSFGKRIDISPMDSSVKVSRTRIIIAPEKEDAVYTISGYFDGQIVCMTKNTVLRLNNAFLENSSGMPVVKASAKIEISTEKDSENFIVTKGRNFSKFGAVNCARGLVLGGSGKLSVKGGCHGIEADDVKIKGSGTFVIEGTKKGCALTCESLAVEEGKTFSAYFLNSKNGIRADDSISILSGKFFLYDNETALKTDMSHKSSDKSHSIRLSGGEFRIFGNKTLYESDSFENNAKIIEE